MIYRAISDCGLVRQVNQDRVAAFTKGDTGLFLVADGMGGHSRGEYASELLVNAFSNWWTEHSENVEQREFAELGAELQQLLLESGKRIWETRPEPDKICGSTAVVLFIQREAYLLMNVGDSRLYLLPEHKQLSRLSVDQAQGGKLLQAVGALENVQPFIRTDRIPKRGVFLLCSDGLYRYFADKELKKQLCGVTNEKDLESALRRMMQVVLAGGAADNASAIMVAVGL